MTKMFMRMRYVNAGVNVRNARYARYARYNAPLQRDWFPSFLITIPPNPFLTFRRRGMFCFPFPQFSRFPLVVCSFPFHLLLI